MSAHRKRGSRRPVRKAKTVGTAGAASADTPQKTAAPANHCGNVGPPVGSGTSDHRISPENLLTQMFGLVSDSEKPRSSVPIGLAPGPLRDTKRPSTKGRDSGPHLAQPPVEAQSGGACADEDSPFRPPAPLPRGLVQDHRDHRNHVVKPNEVVAAVESLYEDELKPFGRILRKRIAERAAGVASVSAALLPDVDIAQLRGVCEESCLLRVEAEEGGDWSAQLEGRAPKFADVYSPVDVYPQELWAKARDYFKGLQGTDMYLPGGRYLCAQVLAARGLPFLTGRSLGTVCHIVQLAISQKKLLGYLNGAVVPYGHSQSRVKDNCAVYRRPAAANGAPVLPLATWETARRCLREMLESARTGARPGMVPLSNVKRLFRSRYRTELSETMLGHAKLSELLQCERFQDVCEVHLEGNGYIVVQVEGQDADGSSEGHCAEDAACGQPQPHEESEEEPVHVPSSPGSGGGDGAEPPRACRARPAPLTLEVCEPHDIGAQACEAPEDEDFAEDCFQWLGPPGYPATPTPLPSPESRPLSGLHQMARGADGEVSELGAINPVKVRLLRCSCTEPAQALSTEPSQLVSVVPNHAGGYSGSSVPLVATGPRPSRPMPLQDAQLCKPWEPPGLVLRTAPAAVLGNMTLSPMTLNGDDQGGRTVRNTFIDAGPPPLTPRVGAIRRSQSLPKDVGSGKNLTEAAWHIHGFRPGPIESDDDAAGKVPDSQTNFDIGSDIPMPSPLSSSGFCGYLATPTPQPSPAAGDRDTKGLFRAAQCVLRLADLV